MHLQRKLEPFPLEMDCQWSWRWGEGKFWFMLENSFSQESCEVREVVYWPRVSASAEGTLHAIRADPLFLGVRVFGKELSQSQHLSSALLEYFRSMDSSWAQPLSYDLRDLISLSFQPLIRSEWRLGFHLIFYSLKRYWHFAVICSHYPGRLCAPKGPFTNRF